MQLKHMCTFIKRLFNTKEEEIIFDNPIGYVSEWQTKCTTFHINNQSVHLSIKKIDDQYEGRITIKSHRRPPDVGYFFAEDNLLETEEGWSIEKMIIFYNEDLEILINKIENHFDPNFREVIVLYDNFMGDLKVKLT